ncbi:MAG: nicotinate-nucleotide diphosphorylase [Collinsella sp.]
MNPITMKLVVDDLILQALREDITFEDVSTASVCPAARPATVELIAKADGIIAGLDVFARTFELLDPQSSVLFDVADGDEVHAGDHVGQVRGDARVLLSGERVALNYLQRMSGIATYTHRMAWRSRAPRRCCRHAQDHAGHARLREGGSRDRRRQQPPL